MSDVGDGWTEADFEAYVGDWITPDHPFARRGGGDIHLYFIQSEHGGPIKIGTAMDPVKRRNQLQTGYPHRLVLTSFVWVARSTERRVHALFAKWRLTGEWFEAIPALAAIARAQPDPKFADVVLDYVPATTHRVPDDVTERSLRTGRNRRDFDAMHANPDQGYVKPSDSGVPLTRVPRLDPYESWISPPHPQRVS